jgi:hypothetical protein
VHGLGVCSCNAHGDLMWLLLWCCFYMSRLLVVWTLGCSALVCRGRRSRWTSRRGASGSRCVLGCFCFWRGGQRPG